MQKSARGLYTPEIFEINTTINDMQKQLDAAIADGSADNVDWSLFNRKLEKLKQRLNYLNWLQS